MATTFYSTAEEGFRAKCVYNVSSTTEKTTISGTVYLQHKGAKKTKDELIIERLAGVGWTLSPSYSSTVEAETASVSSVSKHTDWTDLKSKTFSFTFERYSYDRKVYVWIGGGMVSWSGEKSSIVTVPALPYYSITYNANGGTGAPSADQKQHSYSTHLSSITPTRSGYTFRYWNTKADGTGTTYYPGAYISASYNAALSLYAIWGQNHTISYIADGASSKPEDQTKTYGKTLTLSNDAPQRDGFTFIKWNTAADGSGTDYNLGQTYSTEADLTLYAIWQAIPKIQSLVCIRCDQNGNQADEGEYGYVECVWSIDNTDGDTATVTGTVTPQTGGSTTDFLFSEGASGAGGTAKAIIGSSNGQIIDPDMQYLISVTVTNQDQSSTRNQILTRAFYVMDWKAGGLAVGIGRAAPEVGLEVGYESTFDDNVKVVEDLTVEGNETIENDLTINGHLLLKLDVTIDESTGRAISGDDMNLYNRYLDLGWTDALITS